MGGAIVNSVSRVHIHTRMSFDIINYFPHNKIHSHWWVPIESYSTDRQQLPYQRLKADHDLNTTARITTDICNETLSSTLTNTNDRIPFGIVVNTESQFSAPLMNHTLILPPKGSSIESILQRKLSSHL